MNDFMERNYIYVLFVNIYTDNKVLPFRSRADVPGQRQAVSRFISTEAEPI